MKTRILINNNKTTVSDYISGLRYLFGLLVLSVYMALIGVVVGYVSPL